MVKKSNSNWESTPKSVKNLVVVLIVLVLTSGIILSWTLFKNSGTIVGKSWYDEDNDGIMNSEDKDIDGDGIENKVDPDADGDKLPDKLDPSAYGADSECEFTNGALYCDFSSM